jgi:hypothetical protein
MKSQYKVLTVFVVLFLAGCGTPMDPFMGLERAEQERQFYAAQVTATAEMRLFAVTETAAAFSMAQTQTAYPYTATALAFTPTPNAAATLTMAAAQAESTMIANQVVISNLQVERARMTNTVRAISAYVVGFAALVAALIWSIGLARKHSVYAVPMNEQGDKQPILVDGIVIDPDRMPNGMAEARRGYLALLPEITAERQDRVTSHDQMVDLKSRTRVTTAAMQKLLESQGLRLPDGGGQNVPLLGSGEKFPLPAWEIIEGWEGEKSHLPYGITARGLDFVDVDEIPHIAVISMTGMGKSRRFIRPFVTCALAAGHRVVIVGKSTDYWVFENHPNAALVKVSQITERAHAERYAGILQAIVQEMNKRDEYLTNARKSTWSHAGRERTFVVLDELGNAFRLMPPGLSDQARIWVEGLAAEGRKVGFNLVLANQRATGMAAILSQTGKAIFRVERDEEKGHRSLAGASDLEEGYFFAKFGSNKLAGAFEPSDEEIVAFLKRRPVSTVENDWVDGRFTEIVNHVEGPKEAGRLEEDRTHVLRLHHEGKSMSAIVRELWGVSGGSTYMKRLDEVKAILTSTTTDGMNDAVCG